MSPELAALEGRRLVVEVPASSANLGSGYDCLALALNMKNRIELEALGRNGGQIELTVHGEGVGELLADRNNRFVRGLEAALRTAYGPLPEHLGWRIVMHNTIPLARGLGSSAAAAVAGLVAGNALAGEVVANNELLALAGAIEGHPDNAAAALLGGFAVTAPRGPEPDALFEAIRFESPRPLRAVLFVPDRRLSTDDMRQVLPAKIPLADAVANLGRVALGVAGLATGRYEFLNTLTLDHLHEKYRAALFPELPALLAAAREAGALGACLSGAGSTIIAFADSAPQAAHLENALRLAAQAQNLSGRVKTLFPSNLGAQVIA